ncbi:Phosphatidylcholine-sterol acyltransferase [Thelohanellus kitauei]|uniref:Phosphatidylcholine-sterol acyltransferase n=1 Tax=Thelohanellus kitauei TaxID=669202 RepID=A0A0C2N5G1_THEKT|nr:Phosphatidylcholine-sterol acyltransferase [Thelohanellus kitauei]KII74886.1 Phosphatidylcholine-sterol acyltransferase [Thelohanellus kitauei]
MRFDKNSSRMINNEGVDVRVGGNGEIEKVEYLDPSFSCTSYFGSVIHMLENQHGYSRKSEIYSVPYDFRDIADLRNFETYAHKLKQSIEGIYNVHGGVPVILTSHSMGGLVVLNFLQAQPKDWKDQFIKSWVSIASPFGGSVKSAVALVTGYWDKIFSIVLKKELVKASIITFPSLFYLLPSKAAFGKDYVVIKTKNHSFTVENLRTVLAERLFPPMLKILPHVPEISHQQPDVEIFCVYSIGQETFSRLDFANDLGDDDYSEQMGEGDGTVNIESLQICKSWTAKNSKPVHIFEVNDSNHLTILNSDRFIEIYGFLITDQHSKNEHTANNYN